MNRHHNIKSLRHILALVLSQYISQAIRIEEAVSTIDADQQVRRANSWKHC